MPSLQVSTSHLEKYQGCANAISSYKPYQNCRKGRPLCLNDRDQTPGFVMTEEQYWKEIETRKGRTKESGKGKFKTTEHPHNVEEHDLEIEGSYGKAFLGNTINNVGSPRLDLPQRQLERRDTASNSLSSDQRSQLRSTYDSPSETENAQSPSNAQLLGESNSQRLHHRGRT